MEYEAKTKKYSVISPGTAGIAQRISSYNKTSVKKEEVETSGLHALTMNDVMECSQNQY